MKVLVTTMFTALTVTVLNAVLVIPEAYIIMLALGGLHTTWDQVPALGFLLVWVTVLAISIVGRLVTVGRGATAS